MRKCPRCGNKRTGWRPESLEEAIYGLWTCAVCGLLMNQQNNPLSDEDAMNHRRHIQGDMSGILLAGIIVFLGLVFFETTGEMAVLLVAMVSVIVFLLTRAMARP